jgi:hypothetical protein
MASPAVLVLRQERSDDDGERLIEGSGVDGRVTMRCSWHRSKNQFVSTLLLSAVLGVATHPLAAQEGDPVETEATIAALQTSVATQSTQIAILQESLLTATPSAGASPPFATKPIPISEDFVILYYYFAAGGASNRTYVLGELHNISDEPALAPLVVIEYFDENGFSYGKDAISPTRALVPAGGRTPFQAEQVLSGRFHPGEWSSETLTAGPAVSADDPDFSVLRFDGVPAEGQRDEYAGKDGTLRNDGAVPIEDLLMMAAYYDEDDRFVGECFALLGVGLPPGETVEFTVPEDCDVIEATSDALGAASDGPRTYQLIPFVY